MTRIEIVVVATRILAALLLVQGVAILALGAVQPILARDFSSALTVLILFLLLCAVAAMTWRFAPVLAEKTLPAQDPGERVTTLGAHDLQSVLLRVLGVFFGVTAITGLVYSACIALETDHPFGAPEMVRALVQLIAGIGLVLGTTGLRRVVELVRHGGDHVEDVEDDQGTEAR